MSAVEHGIPGSDVTKQPRCQQQQQQLCGRWTRQLYGNATTTFHAENDDDDNRKGGQDYYYMSLTTPRLTWLCDWWRRRPVKLMYPRLRRAAGFTGCQFRWCQIGRAALCVTCRRQIMLRMHPPASPSLPSSRRERSNDDAHFHLNQSIRRRSDQTWKLRAGLFSQVTTVDAVTEVLHINVVRRYRIENELFNYSL